MRIHTNDPKFPILAVSLMGQVEKFADILPERVHLTGDAAHPPSVQVEIVPRKNYPFTIQNISARDGRYIQWQLEKRCGEGLDRCILRIQSKGARIGGFADILFIETDNPVQPKIPIFITGSIR